MQTEHSFNIKLAMEVGIEKAILLKNIHWWIFKNAKNGKNFRRGRFWTFNSSKAFAEMFPYMNPCSIRRWLIELEDDGWIITGNFNRKRNDKTKWYAVGDRLKQFCRDKGMDTFDEVNLLVQNEQEDFDDDLFHVQNEQSLPDIYTDIIQDVVVENNNDGNIFKEMNEVNLNDEKKIRESISRMFELVNIQIFFMAVDRILNELVDIRNEISKQDAWKIIIDSFVEVAGMKSENKSVNYLLAKIKGKKNEFYRAKVKRKKSLSMTEKVEEENREDLRGLELSRREFEKVKGQLTETKIKKIGELIEEGKHLSVLSELYNPENRICLATPRASP